MAEEWPSYHKGRREHLHALGVIALAYSAFQRGLGTVYKHHPQRLGMPAELVELYYSSLNEQTQLKAIRTIFRSSEKDGNALAYVDRLIDYFDWCSDARNKLLHSEPYPTLFGGSPDKLYLTKPQSKKDPEPTYLWLTVRQLRDIADKIEHGKRECAGFVIYLRCRDIPVDQLPLSYRIFFNDPMPGLLTIPPTLEPSPHPEHGRMPSYVKHRSD
jgi:hypothetical protein